jgi:hypothetical protein
MLAGSHTHKHQLNAISTVATIEIGCLVRLSTIGTAVLLQTHHECQAQTHQAGCTCSQAGATSNQPKCLTRHGPELNMLQS